MLTFNSLKMSDDNEGVDIPEANLVLFLRPTDSLTVFLQQLGAQRALDRLFLGRCGGRGNHAFGGCGGEVVGLDGHGSGYRRGK